jgi:FkbM family methyltransferase
MDENDYYYKNSEALGLTLDEYLRLKKFEYWQILPTNTAFFKRPFKVSSPYWFLQSIEEIFVKQVYKFDTSSSQPLIIDCGANWGLSVIYFKFRFPNSVILAYEADEDIFKMAMENFGVFGFKKVTLLNKAVWDFNGSLIFSSEGSVGGSVSDLEINPTDIEYADAPPGSWVGNYNTYFGVYKPEEKKVEAIRLKDVLEQHSKIDFLKIDIEGAEYKVIMDCAEELKRVDKLFVEYHSTPNHPQQLDEILKVLRNSGFRYYIKEAADNYSHPFIRNKDLLYDIQLNIFCFR